MNTIEIPFVPKCERQRLSEGVNYTQKEICESCKIFKDCKKTEKQLLIRKQNLKSLGI